MHVLRYHKLLTLEAPEIITNNEARALATALTLFRWCKKYEYVDNAVRHHFDRLELMNDEELDALHRPQKNANSRKSMVPLFVYLILMQHSDSEHPLKQQEILSYSRQNLVANSRRQQCCVPRTSASPTDRCCGSLLPAGSTP